MDEKLQRLYFECIEELKKININVLNNKSIGKVDICLAKRNTKRYGCCKQEDGDKNYCYKIRKKGKTFIHYNRFKKHHIEISKWVMELNDDIIKNTIIHELIHCFPGCNNHGKEFKVYANYINEKLGYTISRLGNKEEDYKNSNIEYTENSNLYRYAIICQNCGNVYYRQRLKKDFLRKYRCGICEGKLKLII